MCFKFYLFFRQIYDCFSANTYIEETERAFLFKIYGILSFKIALRIASGPSSFITEIDVCIIFPSS